MSNEATDKRARSLARAIVQAYEDAVSINARGLPDRIAEALRPGIWTGTDGAEQIKRVNTAIAAWEQWSLRQPGPRLASFNKVTGEVEMS